MPYSLQGFELSASTAIAYMRPGQSKAPKTLSSQAAAEVHLNVQVVDDKRLALKPDHPADHSKYLRLAILINCKLQH